MDAALERKSTLCGVNGSGASEEEEEEEEEDGAMRAGVKGRDGEGLRMRMLEG